MILCANHSEVFSHQLQKKTLFLHANGYVKSWVFFSITKLVVHQKSTLFLFVKIRFERPPLSKKNMMPPPHLKGQGRRKKKAITAKVGKDPRGGLRKFKNPFLVPILRRKFC